VVENFNYGLADIRYVDFLRCRCIEVLVTNIKLPFSTLFSRVHMRVSGTSDKAD
jgi:hypothetical protein